MSISGVIPQHYKRSVQDYIRVRAIILGISGIAIAQFVIAIAFLILQSNVTELLLNLSTAIYALASIYFLRYFKTIEGFLNLVLGGFYIYLFALVVINGGLLSDAVFWLAVLLMVSILFTKKKHAYLWAGVVFSFILSLYVISQLGIKFVPPHYDETYRLLNLITFFSPLLISAMVFSSICHKKSDYQNRVLERLETMKGRHIDMVGEITHDLKSPTNRILGLIQIFDKSNLKDEQLEIIDLIKKTSDSSSKIINSLLESPEKIKERIVKYDLSSILEELRKTYVFYARKKDITLHLYAENNLIVKTSKFKLVRIFDNLITNAIKFSRVGGVVTIDAQYKSNYISVLITDSGPGFSINDIDRMFEKSTILTARPTGNESSHGLGLHIVHKLSNELGVDVELIESSQMGSTFEVKIPVQ